MSEKNATTAAPESAAEPCNVPNVGESSASCHRAWCGVDETSPEEHYDHHASDYVHLTGDGEVDGDGWSAYLVQREGEPVKVDLEGRATVDLPWETFEIELTDLETIMRILDDPRGRAGVEQMLRWFD